MRIVSLLLALTVTPVLAQAQYVENARQFYADEKEAAESEGVPMRSMLSLMPTSTGSGARGDELDDGR